MVVQANKQTVGKDFNFFKEVVVSGVSDFPDQAQAFMKFRGTRRMIFVCTAGSVEYSFNGNTLHGKMDSSLPQSAQLDFGTRMEDKVWVRGTGTLEVHAWQVGV